VTVTAGTVGVAGGAAGGGVDAPSSSPPAVLGATGVGRVTTGVKLATYATTAGAGVLKEYVDGYVSVAKRRAWVAFRT
jgi:hypothetical protein